MGKEQPASWYDEAYRSSDTYALDAHRAPWAPLWRAVAARVPDQARVVDIGCGPGHMAHHLVDKTASYVGIDFSEEAIQQAERRGLDVEFRASDAEKDPIPDGDYYLLLEILEHVERDVELLTRIPSGRRVIVSVPNFDSTSHVRHFATVGEAVDRYGAAMHVEQAYSLKPGEGRSCWFILEGVRR